MLNFITAHRQTILGVVLGLIAGYLYYHFIGCNSGACSITSSPLNSSLYGGLVGWLIFDMFPKTKTNEHSGND
ncbi:MAG: hypothetical protein JJU02_00510 [Cryomorphaceae bacterium]|nr:hypothetical protein [Cryomorphaceae bacterium]